MSKFALIGVFMYTELHCHSFYSLLDGLNSPLELAQTAKDLGQVALSITDHGTISGHREMQKACKEVGIKPILGVEAYISATDRFDRRQVKVRDDNTNLYNHIILLAKNQNGLKNLQALSKTAWEEGYYFKPRIDFDLLSEYGDDIIVLSGCMSGLISKDFERGNYERARDWTRRFADRFGGDFYMEIQPHNPPELNEFLYTIGQAFGIKSVNTTDCHFSRPEMRGIEEAFLILSTSPKRDKDVTYDTIKHLDLFEKYNALYPERPISFEHIDVFLHSEDELRDLDEIKKYPDSVENTQEVQEKIGSYDFQESRDLLPRVADDPDLRLKTVVYKGLKKRGLSDKQYLDRVESELSLISKKNFANYFLIVGDMVHWAKSKGIRVGPGRGSAAGSLVCYALEITDVDPLQHDLLFERFIDESRSDYPDIDMDFQKSRRGEVKDYLAKKYGHVASISNFIYFSDKGVIKDAARVFGVPYGDVSRVMKSFDEFEQYESSPSTEWFRNKYPEVLGLARQFRGRLRSVGMHAAGVVTSSEPLENYAPIETRKDPTNKVTGRLDAVAWDKDQCEEVGLIKLDILGLQQLDVIDDAIKLIKKRHGIDIDEIGFDYLDHDVYNMLSEGYTTGVFQADAGPYRKLLVNMGVSSFNELAASNALVRPGAANTIGKEYIARKRGQRPVNYLHPIMQSITSDTYGEIVYQEQVMRTVRDLGGLTGAEANKIRKIIGKKRDKSEFDVYRDKFIEGASQYISNMAARDLWHDFEAHADYSFNKSHAVAYSMISYQTAWLKYHYPLEYMVALYRNEENKDKKAGIIIEMRRLGIDVLVPHVNKSSEDAIIEGESVRLGLTDIKYISKKVFDNLDKHRPFATYDELRDVAFKKGSGISTRIIDAMNKVGAARFPDNPLRGDERDNFYDYLNIPVFNMSTPSQAEAIITPLDDVNENGAFVVKGIVKNVKRSNDGWARVELMDESGYEAFFGDENIAVEAGQMYIMLVGNNSIAKFITPEELDNDDDAFVKYLKSSRFDLSGDEAYIVGITKRRTKKKQLMGNVIVSNRYRELASLVMFPSNFHKFFSKLKLGQVRQISGKRLDDGGLMVTKVV
jgi:DNA polymerase-3 subunit alpha